MRVSHIPLRTATGAFLLNDGLGKNELPAQSAAGLQGMAKDAFPQAPELPTAAFGKALSAGEVAVGVALLAPFVSPVVAGAALTAFSGALLRSWWLTPGMHQEGSWRPTPQGKAVTKDVWMLGTGLTLLLDGVTDGARHTAKRTKKAARRRTKEVREALPV
jgi:hypothetical protein